MLKKWILRSFITALLLLIAAISFLLYMTKDEFHATEDNIDALLERLIDSTRLAGFGVAIFDADTIYHQAGYGYASREQFIPYRPETSQYIASISKTVIGVAMMQAVEQGLVDLNEDVSTYLPFLLRNEAFPDEKITLRQLATHTSSLDYNEKVVETLYLPERDKVASLEQFMQDYFVEGKYGKVAFSSNRPGQTVNYTNIGPSIVAYAIEKTSGMSFAAFTKKHIFDPLKMKQTSWFIKDQDSAVASNYYEPNEQTLEQVHSDGVILYPSRDLITNVHDLTLFSQAIIRRDARILSARSYNELLRPQLDATIENPLGDNSGLFFLIDRNQYGVPNSMIGMNGGDFCIKTLMWYDPYTEVGYLLISNTGGHERNRGHFIWAAQTLASFGHHIAKERASLSNQSQFAIRLHNWKSRVFAIF